MNFIVKISFLLLILVFAACSNNSVPNTDIEPVKEVKAYFQDSITPKIIWEYSTDSSGTILVSHFYKNGKLQMKGNIVNGVRDGKWIAWDDEGRMLSTGNYIDGFENGMWTVWFPNGQKRYEGLFKDGKRNGVWKFYDVQGVQLKEIAY